MSKSESWADRSSLWWLVAGPVAAGGPVAPANSLETVTQIERSQETGQRAVENTGESLNFPYLPLSHQG